MNGLGDVLAVARKARGLTQIELAELVGLTQPAINRYESGDRDPDQHIVAKLAEILGVTDDLLIHGNRFRGALAVDAHMRRHKTTKASAWRQLEARLNLLRVHASFLFEEVAINSEQHVPAFDPEFTAAEDAARLVRAQWRMPMGPVVNLTRWMEAAGCLVFEEDFATQRIDGLSQWVDDYPVMLINANAAPDRKRLTLPTNSATSCCIPPTPRRTWRPKPPPSPPSFSCPRARFGPSCVGSISASCSN